MSGKRSDAGAQPGREESKVKSRLALFVKSVANAIEKRAQLPVDAKIDRFNFVDTGYVDSIEMIKFVLEIETEFGIEITAADMELADFRTIGGLASIIESKLNDVDRGNDQTE
jgi:acyl carrier protein